MQDLSQFHDAPIVTAEEWRKRSRTWRMILPSGSIVRVRHPDWAKIISECKDEAETREILRLMDVFSAAGQSLTTDGLREIATLATPYVVVEPRVTAAGTTDAGSICVSDIPQSDRLAIVVWLLRPDVDSPVFCEDDVPAQVVTPGE